MEKDVINRIRKLNQQHAYTSLQMHEAIARKAGLSGTDHKYLGFLIERGEMTAGELANLTRQTTGGKLLLNQTLKRSWRFSPRFIKNSEAKQKNLLLHFQTRKSKSLKLT